MEEILSIDQIFIPGTSIRIIFSQFTGNAKSFLASIKTIEGQSLAISISPKEAVDLQPGTEIMIQYESSAGVKYLFGSYQIIKVLQDSSTIIFVKPWRVEPSLQHRYVDPKVETPWKVRTASLRRFFRVKVDLPFYYSVDGNVYIGQIVDLSLNGLFAIVQPDSRFLMGERLHFRFQLPDSNRFIELEGEIVRNQIVETTKLGIALNFISINQEIRDRITRYLLQGKDHTT